MVGVGCEYKEVEVWGCGGVGMLGAKRVVGMRRGVGVRIGVRVCMC